MTVWWHVRYRINDMMLCLMWEIIRTITSKAMINYIIKYLFNHIHCNHKFHLFWIQTFNKNSITTTINATWDHGVTYSCCIKYNANGYVNYKAVVLFFFMYWHKATNIFCHVCHKNNMFMNCMSKITSKLDMLMTCRRLKSTWSLSSTSTHPTMVTQKSISWSWMDSHPFC